MIRLNTESKMKYLSPILAIALLFISVNALLIGIGFIFLFTMYYFYGEKFLIFFVIVSFLTLTTKISPVLRTSVQVFNFSVITILFINQFGLKFSAYPKLPKNFSYFIFSLFLVMLISSLNSNHLLLGFTKLITILLFFFLVYILFAIINSDSWSKLLLFSIFICAIINSAILLFEGYKYGFDIIQIQQEVFTSEAYLGKNNVGVIISITIIFLISLNFIKQYQKYRTFNLILLFFLIIGLLITDSRASILFVFTGVATIIFIVNNKIFKIVVLSLIILSILIMITPLWNFLLLYLRVDNIGSGREYLISSTIEVIKHNFLLGSGPAGTKYELYKNLPYILNTPPEWVIEKFYDIGDLNKTHNFYLFLFSDMGIFGFILSLTLPIIYFRNCNKILKKIQNRQAPDYFIVIGLLGCGVFIFTRGLFEQMNILTYGHIFYDLPFWILVSILGYYYNKYVKFIDSGKQIT